MRVYTHIYYFCGYFVHIISNMLILLIIIVMTDKHTLTSFLAHTQQISRVIAIRC